MEGFAEHPMTARPSTEEVRVLDGVARLVAEDTHAPVGSSPLDLEHLIQLEPCQAWMGHVKGNRASGHAVGCEPIVRKPEMGPEAEAAILQLSRELCNPLF
jgi:hypothetical protein